MMCNDLKWPLVQMEIILHLESIFYIHVFGRIDLARNSYVYIVIHQKKSRAARKMQSIAIFAPTVTQLM